MTKSHIVGGRMMIIMFQELHPDPFVWTVLNSSESRLQWNMYVHPDTSHHNYMIILWLIYPDWIGNPTWQLLRLAFLALNLIMIVSRNSLTGKVKFTYLTPKPNIFMAILKPLSQFWVVTRGQTRFYYLGSAIYYRSQSVLVCNWLVPVSLSALPALRRGKCTSLFGALLRLPLPRVSHDSPLAISENTKKKLKRARKKEKLSYIHTYKLFWFLREFLKVSWLRFGGKIDDHIN